ncbi:hypothetical protein N0V85_005065 [Neurospora sp. IMI 360204]|nr:hypothetical protein N0V85_005065 [Neurospora sp. IMI 360204]
MLADPGLDGGYDEFDDVGHSFSDPEDMPRHPDNSSPAQPDHDENSSVGLKDAGTVNSCLFDVFPGIAEQLDCKAVWWDALSIPSESKVCALIRITITHNNAIDLYNFAINGFSALGDKPLAVTSKLVGRMRLGVLYGGIRNFTKRKDLDKNALDGFQRLLDQSRKEPLGGHFNNFEGTLEKNLLEAQLELALLKLFELKREKNYGSDFKTDIKTVRLKIQEARSSLVKLLGESHMLTLEAYTALGELYLDCHGDTKPGQRPAEGEKILVVVLKNYGPHGKAKLALGHPKKVHMMDSLINHYDRIGLELKVNKMNSQL